MDYTSDETWKKVQNYLPLENRLTEYNMPEEYFIEIDNDSIHIDHYKQQNPKGTIVLFHGVGGNGRLLSFISVPLRENGYEVICPDLPLYGYTEFKGEISYETWVEYGIKIVTTFQRADLPMFVFGLSAGGMLAYQVACACCGVKGVIATCILDQRERVVTRKTASNPIVGRFGKGLMRPLQLCLPDLRLPMKMVSNMKRIVNNEALAKVLMSDIRSAGVHVPVRFLYTMLFPQIKTDADQFDRCPFLLLHPGQDMWTDISLSRLFYDRLSCEKELKILNGAGHFPIEPAGLKELEVYCLEFLEKNIS